MQYVGSLASYGGNVTGMQRGLRASELHAAAVRVPCSVPRPVLR